MEEIDSFENILLTCGDCLSAQMPITNTTVNIAKNKGNHWMVYKDNLESFLLEHGGCNPKNIKMEYI